MRKHKQTVEIKILIHLLFRTTTLKSDGRFRLFKDLSTVPVVNLCRKNELSVVSFSGNFLCLQIFQLPGKSSVTSVMKFMFSNVCIPVSAAIS